MNSWLSSIISRITSYFSFIPQRSKYFIFNDSPKLNIISLIVGCIFIYKFIKGLSFDIGLLSLIISFLISLGVSSFILDKFTYSEYKIIRFIQRFLIYNIIYFIIIFGGFYLLYLINVFPTVYCCPGTGDTPPYNKPVDREIASISTTAEDDGREVYTLKADKKFVDNTMHNLGTAAKTGYDKVMPDLGVGAAAGSAASVTIKATTGMAPVPRVALVTATTVATAIGTKVGIGIGTAINQNMDIASTVKDSPHADPNPERVPSPDTNIINSPLESDITSPLQDLLLYSFILDLLILILLIVLLLIIFNKYITNYNLNFISNILNKYMPIKNWFNVNTAIDYSDKFVLYMFIVNTVLLIFLIILKLIVSSTLLVDIDTYITVHNYIHGK